MKSGNAIKGEKVKKESKIGYDGRNLMTRIPKVIEKEANLKRGDKLIWSTKKNKLKVEKKEEDEHENSNL